MTPALPENRESSRLSEAAMIAAAPAIAYILTYAYEFGYASTFSIPIEFISVTWNTVFLVGAILVFVIWNLFSATTIILLPLTWGPVSRRVMIFVPWFLFVLVDVVLHGRNWHAYWIPVLTFVLASASFFLWPLVFFRAPGRTYSEMVKAHDAVDGKSDRPLEHFHRRVFTNSVVRLIIPVMCLASLLEVLGGFRASSQVTFNVMPTSPEMVVLAVYGDTLISTRFDRETKVVQKEFIVSKFSDGSQLDLRVEDVGPLHVEEK
jgi:hypothetical protein